MAFDLPPLAVAHALEGHQPPQDDAVLRIGEHTPDTPVGGRSGSPRRRPASAYTARLVTDSRRPVTDQAWGGQTDEMTSWSKMYSFTRRALPPTISKAVTPVR